MISSALYTKDELLGHSTTGMGFYSEQDRNRFLEELKAVGHVTGMEMQFKLKDGTMLTVLMFSKLIRFSNIPIILSIFYDITEVKRIDLSWQPDHDIGRGIEFYSEAFFDAEAFRQNSKGHE